MEEEQNPGAERISASLWTISKSSNITGKDANERVCSFIHRG